MDNQTLKRIAEAAQMDKTLCQFQEAYWRAKYPEAFNAADNFDTAMEVIRRTIAQSSTRIVPDDGTGQPGGEGQ